MEINLLLFGQLTEIIGKSVMTLSSVTSSDDIIKQLQEQFPALQEMTFSIAINKTMIQKDTPLKQGDEVALLPPFSGG